MAADDVCVGYFGRADGEELEETMILCTSNKRMLGELGRVYIKALLKSHFSTRRRHDKNGSDPSSAAITIKYIYT